MKNFASSLIAVFLFLHTSHLVGQAPIIVSGIVVDSASRQPLPFVAIQIKDQPSGQSSANDGSFSISCFLHDTLVFTRLGYFPFLYIVLKQEEFLKIELVENAKMLKEITIYDKIIIPGVDRWRKTIKPSKPLKFENAAQAADRGILPTFGPGIIMGFGGKDKSKKKRDDLVKTEAYRATINSPEVMKQLMDLYSISQETYYRKLEAFNKENPDAANLTSRKEIISMLIQFFALKEP
ncbi:MAG: carboxypeptidase-like regulatory domain-containing protein [Bacteroidota bacterium]